MTAVLAFGLAALITFMLRSSTTLAGAASTSPRAGRWIALVSPAVLTAMVASAVLLDRGELARPMAGEVLAISSGVLAVRKTGNVSMSLAVGLSMYWLASVIGWA